MEQWQVWAFAALRVQERVSELGDSMVNSDCLHQARCPCVHTYSHLREGLVSEQPGRDYKPNLSANSVGFLR